MYISPVLKSICVLMDVWDFLFSTWFAIVNNGAMNVDVCSYLFEIMISYTNRSGIVESCGSSSLVMFGGLSQLFSLMGVPIHFPSNSVERFFLSTTSLTLVMACLYDGSYPNRYEVISDCGLDFHILDDSWCRSRFHIPLVHLYVILRKLFRVFAHVLVEWHFKGLIG